MKVLLVSFFFIYFKYEYEFDIEEGGNILLVAALLFYAIVLDGTELF